MKAPAFALFAVLVMLLVAGEAPLSTAVNCNPNELSVCAGPIFSGTPPSRDCCTKLNEQSTCFCQYLKNPALRPYISSPNARKLVSTCHTPTPKFSTRSRRLPQVPDMIASVAAGGTRKLASIMVSYGGHGNDKNATSCVIMVRHRIGAIKVCFDIIRR
ncbi:hypothetical protein H6P81_010305 [Aristolochia fimbriata]|uniref:Bifunctional inhibitor/plant lipid transfer protein/seed storage helical domain-containing protein n=1 Tax=Aristolochia fimbriata TaxID=158543 RepID=A0AAV7EQH8_ARIFI|nr:hypothetical protein H6P81_010305 [Aristolochia fimbriata]